MRTVWLIVLVAIVAGLLVARFLGRVQPQLAERVRLSSHLLARMAVTVIFGWMAFELAKEDDPLLLGLALLGLLAVVSLLLVALLVWSIAHPSWGKEE